MQYQMSAADTMGNKNLNNNTDLQMKQYQQQ